MCLRFCSLLLNYIDILLVLTCNLHLPLACSVLCTGANMQDKCQNISCPKKNCDLSLQNATAIATYSFVSFCHTSCYLSITIQRANNNHSFGKTHGNCLRNVSQLIDRSFVRFNCISSCLIFNSNSQLNASFSHLLFINTIAHFFSLNL